jgi:hypothetical protein
MQTVRAEHEQFAKWTQPGSGVQMNSSCGISTAIGKNS